MDRKEFIESCIGKCLVISGISIAIESCASSVYYAQVLSQEGILKVKKSEFTGQSKDGSAFQRSYVMVKTEGLEYPVCLYKQNEAEYLAVYTKCTHQGCEVRPQGDYFVCPCHGSEYSIEGKVLNPPAEKDLEILSTRVEGDSILIMT
jgi:Rieske Fe-S protein